MIKTIQRKTTWRETAACLFDRTGDRVRRIVVSRRRRKVFLSLLGAWMSASLQAQEFVHPGLLHSDSSLKRIKAFVENKTEPAYGSYQLLCGLPEARYDYQMKGPFEIMSRDGQYRFTKDPSERDINAAYYNAIRWTITGNEAHADKSMEIIRAYARTLKQIPPTNDAPLCAGLQGFILVNAAEVMRYTYTGDKHANGWTQQDTREVESMFREVFQPVLTAFFGRKPYTNGNWGIAAAKAQLSFGIFMNDRKVYNDAIHFFYHGDDNGSLPNYIAETGQSQEAGRDQQHAMLGVSCFADMAEVAWTQGEDLYGALDNRIMKGYEYIAKSNLGYEVPFVTWKDKTGKYSNLHTFGKGGMGRFRSIFELAYHHYVTRKGLEMPYTEIVLERIRPEGPGFTCDNTGFGSLLYYLEKDRSANEIRISSPDNRYQMTVSDSGGALTYAVAYNDATIIESSSLGINANNVEWKEGLTIAGYRVVENDSEWDPVYGERSKVRDNYKEWQITLNKPGSKERLLFVVRAYNEGLAFRYLSSGGLLTVTDEYTEFTLPPNTRAFYTQRAQTPYRYLPLSGWPGESDRPLLLTLENGMYVCLTEAGVADYVRTKFALSETKPDAIVASMYGTADQVAPFSVPWRVIMAAEQAGEILENNDLILNLNPPCAIKETSWIKPGKIMREGTLTTEGGMELVDFAVKRRLQYIHFDAGWYGAEFDWKVDATTVTLDPKRNPKTDALDLRKVIEYAKTKGVGVFVYVNQRALQQQLDELLPLYKSWGIAGIKFGFVHVGSHRWTAWMHDAVKKCAQYGLMVDIHDEYRPTGFSRTYPNLLTQEGIRGNEEFPDATHNTILPFTRFVAGAGDYTICYYRQDFGRLEQDANGLPRSKTIQTTPAHQLALSVVFYSPLQFLYWYDRPSDSRDEPELKFFDDVHTVWDDTKALQGVPGEYASVARRKGDEWFVGMITNNDARKLNCSLDFLEPGKDYIAEIYADGAKEIPTRTKVKVAAYRVNATTNLTFSLKASGGAAIRLIPEKGRDNKIKAYNKQLL